MKGHCLQDVQSSLAEERRHRERGLRLERVKIIANKNINSGDEPRKREWDGTCCLGAQLHRFEGEIYTVPYLATQGSSE